MKLNNAIDRFFIEQSNKRMQVAYKEKQAQEAFDKLNYQGNYEKSNINWEGRHFNHGVKDEFTHYHYDYNRNMVDIEKALEWILREHMFKNPPIFPPDQA